MTTVVLNRLPQIELTEVKAFDVVDGFDEAQCQLAHLIYKTL